MHRHNATNDLSGRLLLPALLTLMAVIHTGESRGQTRGGVPRLVVSVMVDQLRSDYLEAFMPLYGENGFRRLMSEGRVYMQAEYPMARPDAASAAATLATGSAPSAHGITGRTWIDRETLCPVFCTDDAQCNGVETTDKASPRRMGVSTIGDELKMATEGRALVYAIAPNAEGAVFSAGHAADGAVWLDNTTGKWCTTDYYGALPAWAAVRNSYSNLDQRLQKEKWEPSSEFVGSFSYFLSGGMKEPFSHRFKGDARFADFKTSGPVNEEICAIAETCLSGSAIGTDDIPDHLAVTFYAGGFRNLPAGEVAMELQDTYVRLDRAVARLMEAVERKVGREGVLLVLTSTGYVKEEQADAAKYRIPTGTFDMKRASALLNMFLISVYGQGKYVDACRGTQIYLNHRLAETKQINMTEMLERTQDFLMQLSGVKDVYTSQRLISGAWTPGISRIRAGYFPQTSGDVMIEPAPGWRYVNEDTRENQPVRESYVPYPIVFFGFGTKAEKINTPVTIDRIAPTLSKAMRIRAPNACAGAPLF